MCIRDRYTDSIDEAIILSKNAISKKRPLSIGLLGNASVLIPEFARRGVVPDLVTDQTSAHDELIGYIPSNYSIAEANEMRTKDPKRYIQDSIKSMGRHVQGILKLKKMGSIVFDYGNNLRSQAKKAGVKEAYDYPGFVPEYIRPLFCKGMGPFRWVALSGEKEDIYKTDKKILEMFPDNSSLCKWIKMAQEKVVFQGLPSRICWLGYGERAKFGLKLNEMVRSGELLAPIVIGRDHLDCGSVASPNRETEAMKDGSDAVADWPILNALLNTASGASWVSFHHGGGVGMGYSLHSGQVLVADGSKEMDSRLNAVLTNDPKMGIYRHADAGYKEAIENSKKWDINIPMLKK